MKVGKNKVLTVNMVSGYIKKHKVLLNNYKKLFAENEKLLRVLDAMLVLLPTEETNSGVIVDIIREVNEVFDVECREESRKTTIKKARYCAARLLRDEGFSFPEIAGILGYANHTSAMDAIRKCDERKIVDVDYAYFCARAAGLVALCKEKKSH